MPITIGQVTTKERLHKLVDELSEREAHSALLYIASRHDRETEETDDEIGAIQVPRALRHFDSGREQPDWAQVVRRSRDTH